MIWKITIASDMSADHEFRVQTVAEMVEFVKANFTDVPGMPNNTQRLSIERIEEFLAPNYEKNPDYHL